MAEIEAITDVQADPRKSAVMARQYGRRFPLPPNKPLNLGRDEGKMDIAIPEDDQISRFQAILTWEPAKEKLTVQTRPTTPGYPNPPANQTLIFDEKSKKLVEAPLGRCVVGRGESFWIGQTRFTLHSDDEAAPESPVDATIAPRQEEKTRAQLEEIPFANPSAALRAMENLPNTIRSVGNEQALFRQMLRVVMDAMPRADAAAIVRIPPDCPPGEKRLSVPEFSVRPNTSHAQSGFNPSKRLAHRAILERRRSCLHCWSPDSTGSGGAAELTMADTHVHGVTPWAVCTPFQDGSRYALYVAGQTSGQWNMLDKAAQDKIVSDLTQYQKIAELLVGVIETTLRVSRLTEQNKVIRRAWPQSLWKYLDDPAELERMLVPEEKTITTLFCDLRNYSLFASQNASQLIQSQREIGNALNTMASAITDRDGVVGGFRGDAVLGFWGWPKLQHRQVELAARAALAIAGRLNDYTRTGRCGVAITHGTAVAGRLGAHDLAVVDLYGPVVNLTFRLEGMTKAFGVPIIVSEEIAQQVREADPTGREMRTRPLGKVRAKGFPEPLQAFELYSAVLPSVPDWLQEQWADAVELFTDGKWDAAASLLVDQFPDDPAGKCLIRVMDAHKRRAPSAWDGSFAPPAPAGSE
ncbi:adenylate/guanylate cyclase domain-containing protein [Gemmata sp. JC717]|uniref:adenylate/guanylate cyclase domain-containing protein n=1 Tax=Gemmata algarum TaxID=2975278 RepID=UPI0021BB8392|nr:adenylate/guanylate cyclase domain-containing protein [Gemmata algarum]MDY3553887.1 adenylate/guanylate cyclase domain-containing protein [Gemmata algarum]